ncbi:MAG: Fur family transcriptional regulator [Geodermatophilaceae bacterium]
MTNVSLTEQLRARGLRVTSARAQVLDAVQRLEHCTPEQIYTHLGQDSRSLNITTVYRSLDLLEELGLIGHTHLGHGAPVYHLAEDQHLHVVCHRCESVISADSSILTDVVATMEREHGFRVDVGHVTLSGECASCRAGSQ